MSAVARDTATQQREVLIGGGQAGLFGLPWQQTRDSALLGWVKDDAHHLAQRIGALAQSHAPARAR